MQVAVYCRLSEEDRNKQNESDDSNSIQNQKTMLIQYALREGWEIYDIYSDDDYAGADRQRPQFNRLLKDAEEHKFDIVLCKTQSRFTRELELVEKYIHGLFPLWGIRFVSIVDNADTANKGNKKSRQINGLVNEWYLEDMSDNIRSVLTSRRENGFHIGSFAPYGYRKDPDRKGHLIIDQEAAAVVREVFTMFAQGYGKTAIARSLNDRGIPTPTEYKRLNGLRYKQSQKKTGTLWKYATVAALLTNEVYIGNLVQGKYGSISYKSKIVKPRPKSEWITVRQTHEPIIDDDLWENVQIKVKQNAKPFSTGEIHPFSKKVVCIHCGYTMRSHKTHGHYYLQCTTRHVAKNACIGAFIPVAELEQTVINELRRLSLSLLNRSELEHNIEFAPNLVSQKKRTLAELEAYEKKLEEYSRAKKKLYLDYAKGVLSENDYTSLFEDFTSEKTRYDVLLASRKRNLDEIERRMEIENNRSELVDQYLGVEHLTREMVEVLIDHVTVGRRDKKTGSVPVEIFWNF